MMYSDHQHVNHHPYTLQLHSKKRKETREKKSVKKHTNKTHHRHNHLISPSSLQHPLHLFNTNHTQPLHLTFKTKYSCFSPNHSTPRKVTILTPTKSQSKYNMILYACTNEKYLNQFYHLLVVMLRFIGPRVSGLLTSNITPRGDITNTCILTPIIMHIHTVRLPLKQDQHIYIHPYACHDNISIIPILTLNTQQ